MSLKHKLKHILQNTWQVFFKSIKITESKHGGKWSQTEHVTVSRGHCSLFIIILHQLRALNSFCQWNTFVFLISKVMPGTIICVCFKLMCYLLLIIKVTYMLLILHSVPIILLSLNLPPLTFILLLGIPGPSAIILSKCINVIWA